MSVRRVITIVLSLAFLVFLILSAYSPVQPYHPIGGEPVEAARETGDEDETEKDRPKISLPFVTPKVTLTAGSFPEDSEELTVQLISGETALLDQFSKLRRADFSGSANVEEIAAWAAVNPQVDVTYTVLLPDGSTVDNRTETLDLSGLDSAGVRAAGSLLAALPALKSVELGTVGAGGISQEDVDVLRSVLPEVDFRYNIQVLGQTLGADTDSLDLSSASAEDLQTVLPVLTSMPKLTMIRLGAEGGPVTWDTVAAIHAACPDALLDYDFTLWGKAVNLSDQMLDLNHIAMDDQGAAVRSVLPYMKNCRVLDMDSCGVSNENMAVIRDENPDVDVVWRIWFGSNYSVRTNVTKILASKPSKGGALHNDVGEQLKYCTKVRYLDLGHNDELSDIGFIRYMPDLEIAVISITSVSDLSPFTACHNIKYIEAGNCRITDLSPLASCETLRHLNVGTNMSLRDISPIYNLNLKRLWLGMGDPVPAEQVEQMRSLHPDCEVNTSVPTGLETDENGNVNNEGFVLGNWKCFQQYLTVDWDFYSRTGYFPSARPLGWYKVVYKAFQYNLVEGAYAFSWNDPKYEAHDPTVAPVNTQVLDTSFLDEDYVIPENNIIPDKLDDPPGELLYESSY